jgi:hypothetical protein
VESARPNVESRQPAAFWRRIHHPGVRYGDTTNGQLNEYHHHQDSSMLNSSTNAFIVREPVKVLHLPYGNHFLVAQTISEAIVQMSAISEYVPTVLLSIK